MVTRALGRHFEDSDETERTLMTAWTRVVRLNRGGITVVDVVWFVARVRRPTVFL